MFAGKQNVIGMTLFKDAAIQFDAVEPLSQKKGFLVSQGFAEEGVILSLACVTVAKHDHGAGILTPDLVQDAFEVQYLFADRDGKVPADLKALFACF